MYGLEISMAEKISQLDEATPQLNVTEYIAELTNDFTERTFMPLDEVWERELGDLLDNLDGE